MPQPPCQQCGREASGVRVGVTAADRRLCWDCFRAECRSGGRRLDVPRFMSLLAAPVPPPMPGSAVRADAACPACGLTFAEVCEYGLVGCAGCYTAFAAALLPAMRSLDRLPRDQ